MFDLIRRLFRRPMPLIPPPVFEPSEDLDRIDKLLAEADAEDRLLSRGVTDNVTEA